MSIDEAIARRLRVQCERFGWMGGMAIWAQQYSAPDEDCAGGWGEPWPERIERPDVGVGMHERTSITPEPRGGDVRVVGPDPNDPATIGCFAAMARKARGDAYLYAMAEPWSDGSHTYGVHTPTGRKHFEDSPVALSSDHATEVEAWLAVLEATP